MPDLLRLVYLAILATGMAAKLGSEEAAAVTGTGAEECSEQRFAQSCDFLA
jgi:hypothetical protein